MRTYNFVPLTILMLILSGCGEAATTDTVTPPVTKENPPIESPATTLPAAQTMNVVIKNYAFTPVSISVKKGTTVTWTNDDAVGHTVTSDKGSELASKMINKGETYSHTFNTVGTFSYHCAPHPAMGGTVVVTE